MAHSAFRAAGVRLQRTSKRGEPAAGRLPLSALRARLDEGSAPTTWLLNPDGVIGRALKMPVASTFTVPLVLSGDVAFSGRVMLLPHDWRDCSGAVRAAVAVIAPDGRRRELWSGTLRASDRGKPRGRQFDFELPAWSTALELRTGSQDRSRPDAVARAVWVEPVITDPNAPGRPPAPSPPSPTVPPPPRDWPLISVLVPVHDPSPQMLEEAIASVRAQTFTNWELCLVDDGSTNPQIAGTLRQHAASDPRIHLRRHDHAGGISAATNTALEIATGQYIALLDHDDTLTPDALQHVANQITSQPDLDMIYSDEDIMADGVQLGRNPKPGWSPDHMAALMYTCHLGVYRRTLAVDLGGFESRFDGCQDYDFVLRLMECTDRIAHIPRILYHWRAHATSTASGDQAKPYAYLAQPGAITGHLRRTGVDAEVQFAHLPGLHRVVHAVSPSTSVDLVLAVEQEHGLAEAAAGWLAQPHPTWSVVLAAPPHILQTATDLLTAAGVPDTRVTTIPTQPGDLATALATAAAATTAEHLLLMQTPAIGLTHDWLTRLIGYSNQPQIAAAGPILLAPDGRIQQAGIALPDGIPLHLLYGEHVSAGHSVVYNLSAVSGILATRRDIYQQLGGLDPQYKDLALIEYCLRATNTDHRIVIVPDARLRTTGDGGTDTTNDLPAIWHLRQAWGHTHTHDPYYNPNYRTDRGDFVLSRYD